MFTVLAMIDSSAKIIGGPCWFSSDFSVSILGYVRSAIYTGLSYLASVANSPAFISFGPL
jgi:hypothetical protein